MSEPLAISRLDLGTASPAEIARHTTRMAVTDPEVRRAAVEICEAIRTGGDAALAEFSKRFGGGRDGDLRVSEAEMAAALEATPAPVVEAIEAAIEAVRAVHTAQLADPIVVSSHEGVTVERRWSPLRRVGAYVPGGKAAYPSTLVMTVVPAKVAGVDEVVVASPADRGVAQPVLLAAAALVGVDELYLMGGAQAIGALAHGTETIRPVRKIVGPGNAWVTAAKLAVFGTCSIDLPAGPSEVLVIADHTADPTLVAVDLLCQAEHGPDSPAVLVTTDPTLADRVTDELARLLPTLERSGILAEALTGHGLVVTAPDLDAAVDFANAYGAEHASVVVEHSEAVVDRLTAVGSVYVGRWAPESAGDYATGANHVLPTGGLADAHGPLSTLDFGSWRQIQRVDRAGLERIAPTITTLAAAEGLTAHALAASIRLETT